MMRIFIQLTVGLMLSGCTVNTYKLTNLSPNISITQEFEKTSSDTVVIKAEQEHITTKPTIVGNPYIRYECKVYEPLPAPKPSRVALAELELATTAREINAITLRNVKELHRQITDYAIQQQKHYSEYIKRCVIK